MKRGSLFRTCRDSHHENVKTWPGDASACFPHRSGVDERGRKYEIKQATDEFVVVNALAAHVNSVSSGTQY